MYDLQSSGFMQLASEHSQWYETACQQAGRLQGRRLAGSFDQGLALYGVAYYIAIHQGEFTLHDGYDPRRWAHAHGLYFGQRYLGAAIAICNARANQPTGS